jgi:hypothetical protein
MVDFKGAGAEKPPRVSRARGVWPVSLRNAGKPTRAAVAGRWRGGFSATGRRTSHGRCPHGLCVGYSAPRPGFLRFPSGHTAAGAAAPAIGKRVSGTTSRPDIEGSLARGLMTPTSDHLAARYPATPVASRLDQPGRAGPPRVCGGRTPDGTWSPLRNSGAPGRLVGAPGVIHIAGSDDQRPAAGGPYGRITWIGVRT